MFADEEMTEGCNVFAWNFDICFQELEVHSRGHLVHTSASGHTEEAVWYAMIGDPRTLVSMDLTEDQEGVGTEVPMGHNTEQVWPNF